MYTEGDYILHLDSDVVLFEEVTYDHIFHLGKPVLPFRRYRDETPDGKLWIILMRSHLLCFKGARKRKYSRNSDENEA